MYCVRCGKKLPGDYNKCNHCPDTARQGAWYCPHCGSGTKQSATLCEVCGEPLDLTADNLRVMLPHASRYRVVAVLLAFFFGAVGAHEAYLGFFDRFLRRVIWTLVSVLVFLFCLFSFRAGLDGLIRDGTLYAADLESNALFLWGNVLGMVAAAVSLLLNFGLGIGNGFTLLQNKSYRDWDGNLLI